MGTQGRHVYPLKCHNWRRSHLSVRIRESEKHTTWSMSCEGFRDHVNTDDSLFSISGGGVRVGEELCNKIMTEKCNAWDARYLGC